MLNSPVDSDSYADFAAWVASDFSEFFAAHREIEAAVANIFQYPAPDRAKALCQHLAKMVANSFSAVVLLGSHGFGSEAMKLVRSMFEASITLAHLSRHPEDADDYFEYYWVVQHHRLKYTQKHTPNSADLEMVDRVAGEFARVSPRFLGPKKTPRSTWSKQSLAQLAEGVGRSHEYDLLYRFGSDIQHAGIAGLFAQLDPEPGVIDADIAPSHKWVKEAFTNAHLQIVVTLNDYVEFAFPEQKPLTSELIGSFARIWGVSIPPHITKANKIRETSSSKL